eukprot:SAG11_NODE_598_length_8269_cov_17.002448_5_plen_271_part_00
MENLSVRFEMGEKRKGEPKAPSRRRAAAGARFRVAAQVIAEAPEVMPRTLRSAATRGHPTSMAVPVSTPLTVVVTRAVRTPLASLPSSRDCISGGGSASRCAASAHHQLAAVAPWPVLPSQHPTAGQTGGAALTNNTAQSCSPRSRAMCRSGSSSTSACAHPPQSLLRTQPQRTSTATSRKQTPGAARLTDNPSIAHRTKPPRPPRPGKAQHHPAPQSPNTNGGGGAALTTKTAQSAAPRSRARCRSGSSRPRSCARPPQSAARVPARRP